MRVRLTLAERSRIQENHELLKRIAAADVIYTINRNNGQKTPLWKRPITEVEIRGPLAPVAALTFEVLSDDEMREYKVIIERLKGSDDPAAGA